MTPHLYVYQKMIVEIHMHIQHLH